METGLSLNLYKDWQKPCDSVWGFIDKPNGDTQSDIAYRSHISRQTSNRDWLSYETAHRALAHEKKIREEFDALVQLWREETRLSSSISAKIFNVRYQRIIGLGPVVLHHIFSELRDSGGHWYWALECITGDNPASNAQTIAEAKQAWLQYALRHGYL